MRSLGVAPLAWRLPRWCSGWFVLCMLLLTACAHPPGQMSTEEKEEKTWSGRIALQVDDPSSPQSFSALFELRGTAQDGGLVLLSPLGNRLAQVDWENGHAQLQSGNEIRSSDSLDGLLKEVTGASIPVDALFSWLRGTQVTVSGWHADLSGIADGRLTARRDHPAPKATLRIALTR